MQTVTEKNLAAHSRFGPLENRRAIRVLVAYENLIAAVRAQEVVQRLAVELRPQFSLVSEVWKFDLFQHPGLRQQAAAEAGRADVIIITCRGAGELPDHVTEWIADWLPARCAAQSSLIALFDLEEDSTANASARESVCNYLRRVALLTGMDFFCNVQHDRQYFHDYTKAISRRRRQAGGLSVRSAIPLPAGERADCESISDFGESGRAANATNARTTTI